MAEFEAHVIAVVARRVREVREEKRWLEERLAKLPAGFGDDCVR